MSQSTLVTYGQTNIYGRSFKCTKRTAAGLDKVVRVLKKQYPSAKLLIVQGCYNTTIAASAGTHDFDACVDVKIQGLSWDDAQKFLRQQGWAAFHRTPAQGFSSEHIHMILIPPMSRGTVTTDKVVAAFNALDIHVGVFVYDQVVDYFHWALGLKGLHDSGDDPSWHPKDIFATILNYAEEIDDMPAPKDWDAEDWAAVDAHIWGRPIHSADERQASNVLAQLYVWLKPKK